MTVQQRLALVLGVLLGACGSTDSMAQSPPAGGFPAGTSGTLFHLHGTVVDGTTGKPISHVLVNSLDRRLATMTNGEGAFALEVDTDTGFGSDFQGFLRGSGFRLFLALQKPGYLQPNGQISVSFDGGSAEVNLTLMPAGAIAGRVSATGPDAPDNVMVALLSHGSNNGERAWVTTGMQRTDRNGVFRFGNLRPGEYTVMTTEWRGDQPLPPSREAVTEQYPPVYFGDSATMAGATKLHLHYGEAAQADLHLRLAKYYPVTVPVGGPNVGISVQVNSGEAPSGYRLGYNQTDHAVEGSLPSGTYTLTVMGMGPKRTYGTAVLHVGEAPVRTAPLALAQSLPITVRFHTDYTGKQTPPDRVNARVYLQPEIQPGPFATGSPLPGQDEVVIPDVAPGRYTVHVEPSYGYVASIQSAGMDLLVQSLVVGEGQAVAPIDVTLRDDSGQVNGRVTVSDGTLPDATFVSFLPSSPGAKFMATGIGPDGTFSLTNLVPGSYLAVASSGQAWGFPYRDPEALRAVASKGVPVTVSANGTERIEVPLTDASALELP